MSEISGKQNEYEFVHYLNNKKVNELNPMFQELIEYLFPYCSENDKIVCWLNKYPQKSDILIKINNLIKGISIKKGSKNSVHVERITNFIHFLIKCGINRNIIIKYLRYHYADGTTNGKGLNRISAKEYNQKYKQDIDDINLFFNTKDILSKITNRFVLKGNNSQYQIEALIYGEVNDFLWISKQDIIDIIMSKINYYSTGIHFGPLSVQPKARCLNFNPLYEKDRFCVQIKWFNLHDDIIEHWNKKVISKSGYKLFNDYEV